MMVKFLITIIILFDNYSFDPSLGTEWGFSAYLRIADQVILFDTGSNAELLAENAQKLKLKFEDVDIIFLSHEHWDHTGGLSAVLAKNSSAKIIYPSSFSEKFKDAIKQNKNPKIEIGKDPLEISKGIWTSGTMGRDIHEQSMFIKGEHGTIVITGCAHPGIAEIVKKSTEVTGEIPYHVIGGFHLRALDMEQAEKKANELKSLNIKKITPTHCTGDIAIEAIKKVFKDGYSRGGAGRVLND